MAHLLDHDLFMRGFCYSLSIIIPTSMNTESLQPLFYTRVQLSFLVKPCHHLLQQRQLKSPSNPLNLNCPVSSSPAGAPAIK